MALDKTDVGTIANTDNVFKAPAGFTNPDGTPNDYLSLASFQYYLLKYGIETKDSVKSARADVQALSARVDALAAAVAVMPSATVDVPALATALAPLLNSSSATEIEDALRTVLRSV